MKENLVDGDRRSKWLVFEPTGWVQFELSEPVAVVRYALSSANDAPERDPQRLDAPGLHTTARPGRSLDTQFNQDVHRALPDQGIPRPTTTDRVPRIPARHHRATTAAASSSSPRCQLSNGDTAPPPATDMRSEVGNGPRSGYTAKSSVGFTGLNALQYAGSHTADGRGYSYNKVFDVDVPVTPTSELSYADLPRVHPTATSSYPSTYAAVDLAFTDGTYLSDLGAIDQHGFDAQPAGPGRVEVALHQPVELQALAHRRGRGRQDHRPHPRRLRQPGRAAPRSAAGSTTSGSPRAPSHKSRARPSDCVVTTRGTNSSGSFSRGNNIPATAVPHGFNFWIPVTNAGSLSWLYEYQPRQQRARTCRALQAFAASHEPSPWMGDRQTFQVMPSRGEPARPNARRGDRALPFRHENEIASPHHYGVTFENGIRTDIAPTDHAALFRFDVPRRRREPDLRQRQQRRRRSPSTRRTASSPAAPTSRSGLSNGATRMFVYAHLRPAGDRQRHARRRRPRRRGYVKFDAGDRRR